MQDVLQEMRLMLAEVRRMRSDTAAAKRRILAGYVSHYSARKCGYVQLHTQLRRGVRNCGK